MTNGQLKGWEWWRDSHDVWAVGNHACRERYSEALAYPTILIDDPFPLPFCLIPQPSGALNARIS